MNTTLASTRPRSSKATLTGRRVSAGIAQLGSFLTTWAFVAALAAPPSEPTEPLTHALAFLASIALEFSLVWAKSELLIDRRWKALPILAIIFDSVLNGGGLWAFVLRLEATQSWQMLVGGLGLESELRLLPALIIALAFGFALSIAPHLLWRRK